MSTQYSVLERLISYTVYVITLMIVFAILHFTEKYIPDVNNYWVSIGLYIILVVIMYRKIVKKNGLYSNRTNYKTMTLMELLKSKASFKDLFKVTTSDMFKFAIELFGYPFVIFTISVNISLEQNFVIHSIISAVIAFIIFMLSDMVLLDPISKKVSKVSKTYMSKTVKSVSSGIAGAVAEKLSETANEAIDNAIDKLTGEDDDEEIEDDDEEIEDDDEEIEDDDDDNDCSSDDD